tara:strand:+ start:5173 stop:7443 length:2271 start_codon:yes stop_codon:yes gene_type:complete
MKKQTLFLIIMSLIVMTTVYSQEYSTQKNVVFDVEVRVVDKENSKPIKNADVSINGKLFRYNYINEYYPVKAIVGQQLVVVHPGFETVYYDIKSNEEIKILVEGFNYSNYSRKIKSYNKSESKKDLFIQNLDSASYYKNTDIEKSLSFVENILKEDNSSNQQAVIYKLLGSIYLQWNQYDLSISNYKTSLENKEDETIKLQLAIASMATDENNEAELFLLDVNQGKLGIFEKVLLFELLGDVYLKKKDFNKAKKNYNDGLVIAEKNSIASKITDIKSKLGDLSAAEGNVAKANQLFSLSLDLAAKENPVRSIKEKEKVANYFNQTRQFDKEINLRKKALEETTILDKSIESIKKKKVDKTIPKSDNSLIKDSVAIQPSVLNSINSQSINYKIGRALVEKEDYKEAIPFLEKSIKDAASKKDLVVRKDATRKLSEVYSNVGEYDKALQNYQEYVSLVDTLYNRKEQEIEQAKRFAKRIAENQNRITSLEKNKALNDSKIDLAVKDQQLVKARNKNQQVVIYSLLGGILLMFFLAYTLFKSNKQQKLANNLLALKSMRSQMNPHFIFNALNSVNSFIAVNDERNANRYLSEFSVLMRSVLENSDEDFIPFTKEVELLELYVKLEHNRFKEKFDYTINIDENIHLEDFSIPPMLLQPYIENAIWHGLRYKEEKGVLEIHISKVDANSISVVIVDDGVGRKRSIELKTKNQLKQKSKGMSTIQKRIEILNDMYQDRIDIKVSDAFEDGTGTKVELLLKKN